MKRQKTVEAYTCDCCGAEIDDKAYASITVRCNGEIYYEWWAKGDYCERCADMLVSAIIDAIPVPERYEDKFRDHDACVECEVGLIHRQIHLFMMLPNGRCCGCQTICAICRTLPANTLNNRKEPNK